MSNFRQFKKGDTVKVSFTNFSGLFTTSRGRYVIAKKNTFINLSQADNLCLCRKTLTEKTSKWFK